MSPEDEAERRQLLARCAEARDELIAAANAFEQPLENLQRAERRVRRVLEAAPQVLLLGLTLAATTTLVRRRRLGLATLVATSLDAYRLWRLIEQYRGALHQRQERHPTPSATPPGPEQGPLP